MGTEVSCATEERNDSNLDQSGTCGEQENPDPQSVQVTARFLVTATGVQEEKVKWGCLWAETCEQKACQECPQMGQHEPQLGPQGARGQVWVLFTEV